MILKDLYLYMVNELERNAQNKNVAFFLIQHFLKIKTKAEYISRENEIVAEPEQIIKSMNDYIDGKPLSKITNSTTFYGLDFNINDNVFSPRLETELLVEIACEKIRNHNSNKILNVADICCGSGVIGLSIKNQLKKSINLYQSDIDESAYYNTVDNSNKLNIESIVNLSPNLEYYYKKNIELDVIISNPPYISINDINVGTNVNKYDPLIALYCGDNGLMVYKTIIQQSLKVLNQDSFLIIFEIGFNQAESIKEYVYTIYPDAIVNVIKDYSQQDRIIVISKNW